MKCSTNLVSYCSSVEMPLEAEFPKSFVTMPVLNQISQKYQASFIITLHFCFTEPLQQGRNRDATAPLKILSHFAA